MPFAIVQDVPASWEHYGRLAAATGLRDETLTFITHVIPGRDAFADVPPVDFSPGDLFVQEAQVFNESHSRQIGKDLCRLCSPVFSLLVIEINQRVPVQSVGSQQNQNYEIGDEQRHIKGIGVIQALESSVEEMLMKVLRDRALGKKNAGHGERQEHM